MAHGLISLYSEVTEVPIKWLWYPYIPLGKITLLQGDPGDGKSTMMMDLIAKITIGGLTPDGTSLGRPMRVIYQCSEDSVSDTIKPRLMKSGADCSKVAFLDEEDLGTISLNDERLRDALQLFRPSLLVIDPIQSYLGNDIDMQSVGKARKVMQRLALWANTYDCAVVLIGHMNKSEGQKNLYRGLGSIDITATARSVLQVERDNENEFLRNVTQIKNNLGPIGQKLSFVIDPKQGFSWRTSKSQKDEYLNHLSTEQMNSQTERAAYLIKQCLVHKDMLASDVNLILEQEGISHRTIVTVKKYLGVYSYRRMRKWYWSLNPNGNHI